MRVCFSFAAYAKNLIEHLKSSNIIIDNGLTEAEFTSIESSLKFTFPPDLRSILQEGLPVSHGFPNWRSSSKTQLEILMNRPFHDIQKQVSLGMFWIDDWGEKPNNVDQAVFIAKGFLEKAPLLVPICKFFYIPVKPCMAGNPIFYVHGGEMKLWSFDIAGFFEQTELGRGDRDPSYTDDEGVLRLPTLSKLFDLPPWAAMEARRIEFWSCLVERVAARGEPNWWWRGDLKVCMEAALRRLRNGGWREEDVREMMLMDSDDEFEYSTNAPEEMDVKRVNWQLRVMSKRLLRAGWSMEDVIDMQYGGMVDRE